MLWEQPTGCESKGVKVPLPSIARFGRLAYPTYGEETSCTRLGGKRHGGHTAKAVSVGATWVAANLEA